MKVDTVIINGTIVSHDGRYDAAIGIKDGKIACITTSPAQLEAATTLDATGRFIIPGAIDAHIHFQDPGFTSREDFEHGTAACAVGGVTTAISHPMNDPPIVDRASYRFTIDAYEGRGVVDYAIHGGGTPNNIEEIRALWQQTGATAIKMFTCFSVKEFEYVNDDTLFEILHILGEVDGLAILHCENEGIIRYMERKLKAEGRQDPLAYNASRPEIAELEAIKRVLFFLEQTGAKAVILHVTSAAALKLIREAQGNGVKVYAETCPHFLTFNRNDSVELGPYLKFSPVMRDEENRLKLWQLLDEGYVNTIGSDHSPYEKKEKEAAEGNIWQAPNGIPGVETSMAVLLDGVNKGLTSLERVVSVTSYYPSLIYGFRPQKGLIQVGYDADLVFVDMNLSKTYALADVRSKCDWSPYFGRTFKGWPVLTMVRGEVVAKDRNILVKPGYGRYVARAK